MTRVRDFFLREAEECLMEARTQLARPEPEVVRLYAAVRRLRGSAEMARYAAIAEPAATLERRLKRSAGGEPAWTGELAEHAEARLRQVENGIEAVRAGKLEPKQRMERPMDERQVAEQGEVVAIEDLEYHGRAALERALELRPSLEDAITGDEPAQPILEEVFELIRLGMR